MLIEEMPRTLTWNGATEVLCRVHDAYVGLLGDSLNRLLDLQQRLDSPWADRLEAERRAASDAALLRVLTAPETSYRLLWEDAGTPDEICRFLVRSLQAEAARESGRADFAEDTWTAIGDLCFRADGEIQAFPQLPGMLPLDFGSPLTAAVDFGGPGNRPEEYREPFSEAETSLVLDRIGRACEGIGRSGPTILDFCNNFNKVLICQKDPAAPSMYSSGSTGQYVGRSFVTNPHLPTVDEVDLAEAMVHEGIHSLLYMQEQLEPWIGDGEVDRPVPRVESPWSGNRLSVRSYLQACFVWYGLAHFWAIASRGSAFDPARVRSRMSMAVYGFLNPSLLDRLQPYRFAVSPGLIDAIDQMQSTLVGIYTDVQGDPEAAVESSPA